MWKVEVGGGKRVCRKRNRERFLVSASELEMYVRTFEEGTRWVVEKRNQR